MLSEQMKSLGLCYEDTRAAFEARRVKEFIYGEWLGNVPDLELDIIYFKTLNKKCKGRGTLSDAIALKEKVQTIPPHDLDHFSRYTEEEARKKSAANTLED